MPKQYEKSAVLRAGLIIKDVGEIPKFKGDSVSRLRRHDPQHPHALRPRPQVSPGGDGVLGAIHRHLI
ncbi:unnamed protein product [Caenorhabditis auriculariae]|uniref:Uncharacterized protein n=1 Tax=Caenorhabditis auriculariae TaxID=2777116 RepID=A0A8S1HH54_9PELO|nr:unnamed protein product [Caenorhabditis auriculariae]